MSFAELLKCENFEKAEEIAEVHLEREILLACVQAAKNGKSEFYLGRYLPPTKLLETAEIGMEVSLPMNSGYILSW